MTDNSSNKKAFSKKYHFPIILIVLLTIMVATLAVGAIRSVDEERPGVVRKLEQSYDGAFEILSERFTVVEIGGTKYPGFLAQSRIDRSCYIILQNPRGMVEFIKQMPVHCDRVRESGKHE